MERANLDEHDTATVVQTEPDYCDIWFRGEVAGSLRRTDRGGWCIYDVDDNPIGSPAYRSRTREARHWRARQLPSED